MFKVLIADDEYYVLSLIQDIVDWEKLDMCVVGTADNGHTALELVQRYRPDIMIVDVRMPGYDGITLMQKVRELGGNIKFIVISGHKRFEYAKSAMKYNVEDYLLKPISKAELEGILLRLKQKLDAEREKQREIAQLDNQLGISKNRMQELFMQELLAGAQEWRDLPCAQINRAYLTAFAQGLFRCVIVKLDSGGQDLDRFFLEDFLRGLSELYIDAFSAICIQCLCTREAMRIDLLLHYGQERAGEFAAALEQARQNAAVQLEKFEGLSQTIGVGEEVRELRAAPGSLEGARKAIDSRFALGVGRVLAAEQVRENAGLLRVILSDQRSEQLADALKGLQGDEIRRCVAGLFALAASYTEDSALPLRLCREIHRVFFEYLRHIDVYKGSREELFAELWPHLEQALDQGDVRDALIRHMVEYIEANINSDSDAMNPSVRIAMRYVQNNYQNNLSLSVIASVVNLTPVYFSILFKRETNMTFIDYVNKFRVDTAKQMLKDSSYNINEIAEKCGYQDPRYFSKIFKKYIGITPSEYRSRQV